MEAVRRSSSPRSSSSSSCRRLFLLLLLLVVVLLLSDQPANCAAPASTPGGEEPPAPLGKYCPSLDACRGGVPNLGCCTAINDAINNGECSCVCRQLKLYNHGSLAGDCNAKWCIRCGICRCAMASDVPYAY